MTLKESYDLLKKQGFPKKPTKCIEYTSCFVFHFGGNKQLDYTFSVNKKDKSVRAFFPTSLPPKEFNNPLNTYQFDKK